MSLLAFIVLDSLKAEKLTSVKISRNPAEPIMAISSRFIVLAIRRLNKTVIIIGHNPTISVMASRLDLDAMVSFNPCSVGIFDINSSWNSVLVGDAKLVDFFDG